MNPLKIRASSLGKIMNLDNTCTITEKQLLTLEGLLLKVKLTDKQAELRDVLIKKRDALPILSTGAKSYIRELHLYLTKGVRQEINSKYIDKGNEVESLSIELASIMLEKEGLYKNDEYFSNDYLTGTPDVITEDSVIDVKSSWSAATFPFYDTELKNKVYEWQLKAYMMLTGKSLSYLCYCLVPTPEVLILDEMRRVSWKRGEAGEVSEKVENDVREYFDLSKIPEFDRIKTFKIELTFEDIVKIKQHVRLARDYYSSLS